MSWSTRTKEPLGCGRGSNGVAKKPTAYKKSNEVLVFFVYIFSVLTENL